MAILLSEPLTVERLTLTIADLPLSLSGLKIAQLSDFHYDGKRLDEGLLDEAIETTNQENPDLIALTGDYVTHDPTPVHQLALKLKNLRSTYGIYGCLGNHDHRYSHSSAEVTKALTDIGIIVLNNEIAYPFGESFPVVGIGDYWSKDFKPELAFSKLPEKIPRLVLSHNPDTAAVFQEKNWRVDLQLSGHTHGGQIDLPGIGPLPSVIKQIAHGILEIPGLNEIKKSANVVQHWEWARGWHQVGRNQLYVNRGLGSYTPGRLNCPPELTVITLLNRNS